ncbi:hypothetical protein ICL81_09610 [Leucobacter sp. cx-328]|uniref:hypothetical protein n=1 Tax=unclassified Leucobacter TaxID=2621730 RepID=UPI00165DE37C|nr:MULTISPECIES: hypothetical protein [unclassified Leucobacter]MBC9944764.1 hypothetical protein [Leucobacter sp. cx-328]
MASFETSLLAASEVVAPELTDLFATAQSHVLPALKDFKDHETRRVIAPLMLRAKLSEALKGRQTLDTEGWHVHRAPLQMMSITLTHPELNARFRLMKERDSYPGGIPTAKPGTQRSGSWNPGLFETVSKNELLWLYDITNIQDKERWEIPLRFVRTIGIPTYGNAVPYDLSIPLVAQAGFYADRTFSTADDTDFFANLRREENESNS